MRPATSAFIWPPRDGNAPEIGADAIGGAIAIVAGGLAVLRDRIPPRPFLTQCVGARSPCVTHPPRAG
jgi:hypothetical protein